MRTDIENRMHEIIEWIGEFRPKNWICKQLLCRPSTLDRFLKKSNIEYKGNQGEKGFKVPPNKKKAIFFLENDSLISSSKLRKKLIEEGIKEDQCEYCGNERWMGKKIPLDLHHLDGNRFNNKLDNLQILCKNCHGLTPNHSKNHPKKSRSVHEKP